MTPRFNMETQFGKITSNMLPFFHPSKVSSVRSQPCQRLQNTLLGVTLLKDLITLLGSGLVK